MFILNKKWTKEVLWIYFKATRFVGHSSHQSGVDIHGMVRGTASHITTAGVDRLGGIELVVEMLVSDIAGHSETQLWHKRRGANACIAISPTSTACSRAADAVGDGMGGLLQQGPIPTVGQTIRKHRPAQRHPHGGDSHASVDASVQSVSATSHHAGSAVHIHRPLAHHPRLHGQVHEIRPQRPPARCHTRIAQKYAARHGNDRPI